ncbi:hypothetical protein XBP1_520077 [Xenorhabdus bovienii str. puntauvense]|uniref:Phage tail fibre protein N-terminal domain-containing protein n=1 Tax=Xenorhabdus bovienii str. puntauvense TaxID=1398201 RepID=A0A077NM26_XENBV|nr:phage tail protein [Xenorhabdus bovienii]CDG98800.1 hypothetical protein XBP1_520077 [Xenorhabdus bovienii str. puntauvense]
MSTKYFALLTRLGADKLANAAALGTKLEITHMAVGDGGGSLPTPHTTQAQLINERRRAAINVLSIDPKNTNQIIAEQVIPESEGGWWIREIGLFDKDGILIAVGNCAETYKPQLQEGSGRTQTLRMVLIVSSTDAVTLKIDPAVVLATREYADTVITQAIREHEQSRHHPDATLKEKGFVVLSNAVNSPSETQAATPKAVKAAYDLANTANDGLTRKVSIEPTVLNGSELISEQLMNGFGVAIRGSTPIPTDAPTTDGAIKVVQIGHNAWPTLLAFSAYENKMFIRTRKTSSGAWNDWLDITDYVTNAALSSRLSVKLDKSSIVSATGSSTTQVMSQKSVTDALNTRLEKSQNGADIPNKPKFIENLGLAETKKQAENAMAKWQNGADISDKNAFVNNLGLTDTVDRANNTWLKPESDNRYIQSGTIELGPTALSELAGKTGFYSRASKPLPPDSPLPNALKILTMGDTAWPTQMVYSSYENRAFIRTRTEANGRFREWSEFLTDNQLTQTTGGSTIHVMSQQAVTTVTNALSDAVRGRLPIAKFNELPVSFENVLTGQHGTNSPVTLRKSISNRLIFLQHGGHPGYTPLAYGVAGARLEFKFGEHGYTAFDVSADGRILSNWRFTSGYSVIGVFIVNGDA